MGNTTFSVNLALPVTPISKNTELFEEFFKIYTAIRALARGLDDYTQAGLLSTTSQLTAAQTTAQLELLKKELIELQEGLLACTSRVVNWDQPEAIGSTTPNTAAVTELTVSESLTVAGSSSLASTRTGAFGANGAAASGKVALPPAATDPATAQALTNAMRNLLINFGLGS